MIIVHIHHTFYPVIGGLERAVQKLAETQAKMGHEVHVITSTYGASGRPKEERAGDIYVHRVKSLKLYYPDLTMPLEVPRGVLKRADIIHIHSQNSYFNVKIAEEAKRAGIPVAVHFMAIDALYDHPNLAVKTFGPYYAGYVLKKALRLADLRLARSLRDLDILRKRYGVKDVYSLPDGVDKEFVEKKNMENEFREKFGVYEDVILFIGRLHKLKGLDVLIKATPTVARRHKDVRFVVIGPGDSAPYMALTRRLGVEDRFLFLGFVDEDTKIGALDSSVCLALPSVSAYVEVYPMVISEAWARRKPVVASSVGGIPYRVKHMENGILVPPRDPEKLGETLLALLEDKELAKRLGERGFYEVKTWSQIAEESIKLYTTTLKQ